MTDWNKRHQETTRDYQAEREAALRLPVYQPGLRLFEQIKANLMSISAFEARGLEFKLVMTPEQDWLKLEARLDDFNSHAEIFWNPRDQLHWSKTVARGSYSSQPLAGPDAATEFIMNRLH